MIKKLAESIGEFKLHSFCAALFAGLEVVMEILVPYLMASIIDKGIYGGDMPMLYKLGAVMIGFVIISLLFGLLAGGFAADASTGFARNLRKSVFFRVQHFSFANIDKFSTAGLVTRLTTDITNVQIAYQMIVRIAVRAPLMLIFALIMSFRINAQLATTFLFMVPILGGGLAYLSLKAHPIFEDVFDTYDVLNSVVQENLSGIRVVKSFVREEHEKSKFQKISTSLFYKFCKAEGYVCLNMPLMMLVVYVGMIIISWFGARIIILSHGSALTTGELTSLIAYVMMILTSLMMLSMVLVLITIAQSSCERIVEVLNEKSTLPIKDEATSVKEVKNGEIVFDNVNFSYRNDKNKLCLTNINLSIPSGSTVGIIGGTGSGKSSLISLIPRLYDVTTGSVSVGGVNVKDYNLDVLRNEVSVVLQKNVLFSGTIKENIRWGKEDATDEEIIRACQQAQASEFIENLPNQYDYYIEQGGSNVSGGQKQRLCIARALIKKPKVLILDDSTSAVDTKTDALIRKAFKEEIPNTTKIIIAQRISSIEDADMIIVMDNGNINAIGKHSELLKNNAIYKEVFESQQKGGEEQ